MGICKAVRRQGVCTALAQPIKYALVQNVEARRMMAPRQGWQSSLVATVVLVVLGVAFVAGTAAVALLAKSMPALTQ
jgi:hypothetical protein